MSEYEENEKREKIHGKLRILGCESSGELDLMSKGRKANRSEENRMQNNRGLLYPLEA